MISNIFGDSNHRNDRVKKAEELAKLILKVSKFDELSDKEKLVVYSKGTGIIYSEHVLDMVNSRSLGRLIFNQTKRNYFMNFRVLLNLDQIVCNVQEDKTERLSGLCVNKTITNLFVFTLLHELGHYTQYLKVNEHGVGDQLVEMNDIHKDVRITVNDGKCNFISVKELYAEWFACKYLHAIILGLEKHNPKYLTYLD